MLIFTALLSGGAARGVVDALAEHVFNDELRKYGERKEKATLPGAPSSRGHCIKTYITHFQEIKQYLNHIHIYGDLCNFQGFPI